MAAAQLKTDPTFESEIPALFAKARAGSADPAWLQPLRAEALARVVREGLPHRRIEAWKYTDLHNKLEPGLRPAVGIGPVAPGIFDKLNAHRIDIASGRVVRKPNADDLPDGLEILSLAEALEMPALWLRQWLQPAAGVLQNLNLAFATDGALIRVGRGVRVAEPVLVRSTLNDGGAMANVRSLVALEEGAELTLVEFDDGRADSQSFLNNATSVVLEAGARLRHLRVTANAGAAVVVRSDDFELARDAAYEGVVLSIGAGLARQQMNARLAGTGATFNLACAYAPNESEHTDFTFEVTHTAPHTTSRMLAKGVAAGNGHGVVQGRVIVKSEAQKTDSHQLSRALLLSPHAEIDQKPELEIFADDVKCGHGAAIGALDPDQLFYLRARGIPEREARNMLVAAFLGEIVERVPAIAREAAGAWLTERMVNLTGGAK
jgi:Fe-S cluster assembly protein SufD